MYTPEQNLVVDMYTTRDALRYVAENLITYQHKPDLAGCALLVIAEQMKQQIDILDRQDCKQEIGSQS